MGKEFYNVDVQRLLNKHGINHYSTYSIMKASIVERFNRWRLICGRCLRSTEITCYRVSCRITMPESIEWSAYDPLT